VDICPGIRIAGGFVIPVASEEFEADPEHLLDLANSRSQCKYHDTIMSLDAGFSLGQDDFSVAMDGPDADAVRQVEAVKRFADQRRGFQRLCFDHLGLAVLHGMHAAYPTTPDMAENFRNGDGTRVDVRIDTERAGKDWIGGFVQQAEISSRSQFTGHDAGQDVDLVVIGQSHKRVGVLDVGLAQDILIERTAVQNNRTTQFFSNIDGAVAIVFDDLDLGRFLSLFQ